MYVKTDTVLDKILVQKVNEIAVSKQHVSYEMIRANAEANGKPRDMLAALQRDTVALIAEVKKASPSKGVFIEDFDPVVIGKLYDTNGAAAISVLTDEKFFQGHLDYMRAVRDAVTVPVLRKDFIIDPYQIYEGRAAGADAMLLIVAALEDRQMQDLYALITELGMTALVEVHNEHEMERALKLGAKLIGVNNRDLKRFNVDLETTARLSSLVPKNVILVAESGIRNAQDVYHMGELGAHAILVGETLVTTDDMAATVREFSSQKR